MNSKQKEDARARTSNTPQEKTWNKFSTNGVQARHRIAFAFCTVKAYNFSDGELVIVAGYPVRTEERCLVLVPPPAVTPSPESAASVAALVPHEAVAHPFFFEANALRGALHVLPSPGLYFLHCDCSWCRAVLIFGGHVLDFGGKAEDLKTD